MALDSDGGIQSGAKACFCLRLNDRLELEDMGSEGHGAVGCAVAVDAAIDTIVGRGLACPTDS